MVKLKDTRVGLGLSYRGVEREIGVSTRTQQDVESGKRKMRRETAIKYAPLFARHEINPTDVEEVSEALGIGPRYQRPDLDASGVYHDEALHDELGSIIERAVQRRLAELEAELQAELRRAVEREVERRVAERIAAREVRTQ